MSKTPTSWRLSQHTIDTVSRLSTAWGMEKTVVIEHAIDTVGNPALIPVIGDTLGAVPQALNIMASILRQAHAANAKTFTRPEWHMMADVCNGHFVMVGENMLHPATEIWPNVYDGHRLDRVGDKWFAKNADAKVQELVAKLQGLDLAHGLAALVSIQWFWEHHEQIVMAKDEWWTQEFRQATMEQSKKCE